MNWVDNHNTFEEEGYGKYPVLDRPGEFVYAKYDHSSDETMKSLLKSRNLDNCCEVYARLSKFCDKCYSCINIDGDYCAFNTNYYLFEFKCDKSNELYYLISMFSRPWIEDEEDFIFIPAHPFNIEVFKKKYLDSDYIKYQ